MILFKPSTNISLAIISFPKEILYSAKTECLKGSAHNMFPVFLSSQFLPNQKYLELIKGT